MNKKFKKKEIATPQSDFAKEIEKRIKNKKWLRYSSEISRRILAVLRSNPEINQQTLAAKLEVSPQRISTILKGESNLELSTIAKLADAVGVDLISFPNYNYQKIVNSIPIKSLVVVHIDPSARYYPQAQEVKALRMTTPYTYVESNAK